MQIPIPLIVSFLTIFFSIIMLIAGWAYSIINQNTKALSDLALIVARLEERYNNENKLCDEKHKVINHRIYDLEQIDTHKKNK